MSSIDDLSKKLKSIINNVDTNKKKPKTFLLPYASASDLDLSHTIIGGFTANSAFENAFRHFYIPGLSPNQLAGADKKFTVTTTNNGSNISLGTQMFSARGDFSSATVVAGTTDTIVITIVGIQLSYGQHYGIQFGNDSFRAKDIKIERSTDNGSTWSDGSFTEIRKKNSLFSNIC
mgnify:CR=1 FL=1